MTIGNNRVPVNPEKIHLWEIPPGWGGLESKDIALLNRIIRSVQHIHTPAVQTGWSLFLTSNFITQNLPGNNVPVEVNFNQCFLTIPGDTEDITNDSDYGIFNTSQPSKINLPDGLYIWHFSGNTSLVDVHDNKYISGNLGVGGFDINEFLVELPIQHLVGGDLMGTSQRVATTGHGRLVNQQSYRIKQNTGVTASIVSASLRITRIFSF